jgi:hypothetical protein
MRGCFSILILAAGFILAAIWFGGPPLAGTVVEATLTGSGFSADELDVKVEASVPVTLVAGRADRVTVDATGVRWSGLRAGSMSLAIDDVDLFGRTAGRVEGRFDDAELTGLGGAPVPASISISGPASAATTKVRVDRSTVERLAAAAFQAEFGIRADTVALVAPDEVRLGVAGQTLSARLEILPNGGVAATSPLGTVTLVTAASSLPLTLSGLAVGENGLELTGTIDIASLLD